MHPFEQTVSVVGPVVAAVIILTLFFQLLARYSAKAPSRMGLKGIFDDRTPLIVHLSNGTTYADVRLAGFTDAAAPKGHLPYDLHGMVILEHADGRRTLIHGKSIRMIEIAAPANG